VAARGLVPSSQREDLAENQCFELFITKELRLAYESKLLRSIEETAATRGGDGFGGVLGVLFGGGRMAQSRAASRAGFMNSPGGWNGQGGGLPVSDSHGGLVDASLAAAEEIGDIFKQLINFTEANASSFVLERPFLDRITNMPPETVSMMQGASPVFYHDFQMNFQKVMFYGIELQLLIFDLLVFTALDKEFNSFAIAAFLTWLVGIFVDHLRGTFGETNISRKSLIDGRFLI
jgi:meckelin